MKIAYTVTSPEVQTDRVLALLKAVGYTTIEFTQSVGETLYDKIFTPYQNGEWRPPVIIKFIDSAKTSLMVPHSIPQRHPRPAPAPWRNRPGL